MGVSFESARQNVVSLVAATWRFWRFAHVIAHDRVIFHPIRFACGAFHFYSDFAAVCRPPTTRLPTHHSTYLSPSLCWISSCRNPAFTTPLTMVHHVVDQSDLETKLTEAGESLVVIDFFATWCGPCKIIGPKLEELSQEYPDVIFLKVDVDECEEIATEYNISAMPTFVFLKSKNKVDSFSGASYEKLKEKVDQYK